MAFVDAISAELAAIRAAGLTKNERIIESPQGCSIKVGGVDVVNLCANNYLGLANDARLIAAAKKGLDEFGLGMSSVRFICGTQTIHKELEKKIAAFLHTEDAILYTSCFDANAGLFETLLDENDAVISDALNHASIIDGIRLCRAQKFKYAHADLAKLEAALREATEKGCKKLLVATDGVFSMDGDVAKLFEIRELTRAYGAYLMVDDSHATGFFGPTGRGSIEHCGVLGDVDIVTSTLGKALGGSSGGFTAASSDVVQLLRQRSRPYLFSNSLPPALVSASIACFGLLQSSTELQKRLKDNTAYFRAAMRAAGFNIPDGIHPIVPVMLGDARIATTMADALLNAIGSYWMVRRFSNPSATSPNPNKSMGSGSGCSGSVSVQPMVRPSMPCNSTMSPATASSCGTRSSPWNPYT